MESRPQRRADESTHHTDQVHSKELRPKASYAPLVDVIDDERKIKRLRDLPSLSLGAPLGNRPRDVSEATAVEFVKEFLPKVWSALEKSGKKRTLSNLRDYLDDIEFLQTTKKVHSHHEMTPFVNREITKLTVKEKQEDEEERLVDVELPDMDVMYIPLADMILHHRVETMEDIQRLAVPMPEGLLPRGVEQKIASSFVKTFLPSLIDAMTHAGQDINLDSIGARLLSMMQLDNLSNDPKTQMENNVLKYQLRLPEDIILALRDSFGHISRHERGELVGVNEIKALMEAYGQKCTDEDVKMVLDTFSQGRSDRYIDFMDFALHLSKKMDEDDNPYNVIFDTINKDMSGELKPHELMRWIKTVGDSATHSEVKEMLKKVWTKSDLLHVCSKQDNHVEYVDHYYDTHRHKKYVRSPRTLTQHFRSGTHHNVRRCRRKM